MTLHHQMAATACTATAKSSHGCLWTRSAVRCRRAEPYAIDHQAETAWFTQVHADEIGLVTQILRESEADLRAAILDWEADRALEAVAHLCLATGHIDGFVDAATALGSRSWQPIVAVAEHACDFAGVSFARLVEIGEALYVTVHYDVRLASAG